MIRKKKGSIEWLEFEKLADIPCLTHGVFLRHGGVSKGPYASLNAGGGSGDNPVHIEKNRSLIQEVLDVEKLISANQVHKDDVALVTSEFQCTPCDALVTQEKGIGLMIKHADCQAALFYDPLKKVIANAHSGWRGNVQNIYAKTISYMVQKFGTNPQDLIVCISPSLGPVASEFTNYKTELPPSFWPYQFKPLYFDLWEISKQQLLAAGVLEQNIEIARICTFATPQDFFSYRRDKITGRNATVIAIYNSCRQ